VKVLVALPYAPSLIRVRSYNLLRELARRHEVGLLIAGARPSTDDLALAHSLVATVDVVPSSLVTRALSCAQAPWRRQPLQAAVNRSAQAGERLAAMVRDGDYDVVHVEHLRSSFLAAWLPPNVPRVFDAVDCISLLWTRTIAASHSRRQRLIARLELAATRRYEAGLMAAFDQVAVTAPEDAEVLGQLEPSAPLTVIPNGVDLDYFCPAGRGDDAPTLVFSGKMSYHANVTAVLHFVSDILPRIRAVVPDVRLRIVGSDPPPSVRRLADDRRVEVTGYLADLRPAIGGAAVAVCPVTVKVGIQNKILEAMAMGVPVVASALGARGLAAQAGRDFMVAEHDEQFAQHVVTLLLDRGLRERIGATGRAYVERAHSWGASAEAFGSLYNAAIGLRFATSSTLSSTHRRSTVPC
jgi:sugar transferase (PEP-CTERM/EpsH1 system associated)